MYTSVSFQEDDYLLFGGESHGLPAGVVERAGDSALLLPMPAGGVRSLNLANAVAIALYEALRQVRRLVSGAATTSVYPRWIPLPRRSIDKGGAVAFFPQSRRRPIPRERRSLHGCRCLAAHAGRIAPLSSTLSAVTMPSTQSRRLCSRA